MLSVTWLLSLALGFGPQQPAQRTPPGFDYILVISGLTMYYPEGYGVARAGDALPVGAELPLCDPGFDVCLYYRGAAASANPAPAALRVKARADLVDGFGCQNARPAGYDGPPPERKLGPDFSSAHFSLRLTSPGHPAHGDLWRLRFDGVCWELETRIVAPPGGRFDAELNAVVGTLTLPGGESGVLAGVLAPPPLRLPPAWR